MSFKQKILSKSNSYNFYKTEYERNKKKYESTLKENSKLKEKNKNSKEEYDKLKSEYDKLNKEYKDLYNKQYSRDRASIFCSANFHNYSFRDDFPSKLDKFLKNLPEESKKRAMLIYLRANAAYLLNQKTLYTNEELKTQEEHKKFYNENVSENKICGFKFTDRSFNEHCFLNDFLTDADKEYIKNKDIIDAGAYIGDSSLAFTELTSANVHAFEPFKESYNKMLENIELNNVSNIVPVNASLSDKNGGDTIYLSGNNIQGITSDKNYRRYTKSFTVKGITIDKYVQENNLNVGFIKVDVEGTERRLLKGAIETLKSQKPILLFSIYHTPDDFFELKPMIEKLDLGYNFKISKERPTTFLADTVLECRPY